MCGVCECVVCVKFRSFQKCGPYQEKVGLSVECEVTAVVLKQCIEVCWAGFPGDKLRVIRNITYSGRKTFFL